ncbi:MAG: hypothetical protein IJ434_06910 [Alistipes sp.]|nr:hypothetical protein [Alistipes sp.]
MRERISIIDRIKGCLKSWLLPHPFKIVGQVLILAVLAALAIQIIVTNVLPDGGNVSLNMESLQQQMLFRRVISIVLYLAIFFITCSREKNEDEMTAQLRGEVLKEVCYVVMFFYIALKIAATIFSENIPYIMHDETSYIASIIWMLYYGRFELKMKSLRRQSRQFNL